MEPPISENRPIWILIIGFFLVFLLLGTMAWLGRRQMESIRQQAAQLVREHIYTARLVDDLEREEQRAGAFLLATARRAPQGEMRARLHADLRAFQAKTALLSEEGQKALPGAFWPQLAESAAAYVVGINRALDSGIANDTQLAELEQRYSGFLHHAGQIIKQDAVRAAEIEGRIERESGALADETGWLLGGYLLLALICTALTIRFTLQALRQIEWQARELNRVSWFLIQGQEEAARRFSHEMHDELGQSLTGLKAMLTAVTPQELGARRPDCLHLLDEAIGNVRELSQLLRPLILDDFGLEAALRWLAERFQERTRIVVEFTSNFNGRLADADETHLFRITQEALTNVARHSGATRVRVALARYGNQVVLSLTDNGQGLPRNGKRSLGLGLVGMRARAEQIGGALQMKNEPGGGFRIEVIAPLRRAESEQLPRTPQVVPQ